MINKVVLIKLCTNWPWCCILHLKICGPECEWLTFLPKMSVINMRNKYEENRLPLIMCPCVKNG